MKVSHEFHSKDWLQQLVVSCLQQRTQSSSTSFKPTTNNKRIFDGKNKNFVFFESVFQTKLKTQPQMLKPMKKCSQSLLGKEALQTLRSKNDFLKCTLQCVCCHSSPQVRQITILSNSKRQNDISYELTFDPIVNHYLICLTV